MATELDDETEASGLLAAMHDVLDRAVASIELARREAAELREEVRREVKAATERMAETINRRLEEHATGLHGTFDNMVREVERDQTDLHHRIDDVNAQITRRVREIGRVPGAALAELVKRLDGEKPPANGGIPDQTAALEAALRGVVVSADTATDPDRERAE